MKTLIVYQTYTGYTERCVHNLANKIRGKIELYNAKERKSIDLSQYDKVIVGGSIIAGRMRKGIVRFCKDNIHELINKKVGLFVCCGDAKRFREYVELSFPKKLYENAIDCECFGGDPEIDKAPLIPRLIAKKIFKKQGEPVPIPENIDKLSQKMNNA